MKLAILRGTWVSRTDPGGCSVKPNFDSKFHFHWKFWIHLVTFGYCICPNYSPHYSLPYTSVQQVSFTIGVKHSFSCINVRQVPREVLKIEAGGRGLQLLPRDLANVNPLKNHVRLLLLHENWKHLLYFALFLGLLCFAFSPMSLEHNFYGLCSFQGRAVHIS